MLIAPEDVVYQRLASTPGVARYVGFQIFPVAVPNGAEFPFVVYRRANISRESDHARNTMATAIERFQ